MRLLSELIKGIELLELRGTPETRVNSLVFDSRKATNGAAFFAVKGTQSDGHEFIEKALLNGASVVFCEQLPSSLSEEVTYVQVSSSPKAMAHCADAFYNSPSKEINLVGVTGTNGKTSVVTMLHQLFTNLGERTGMLSTVENRIGSRVLESTHTTPDVISVNALLREMLDAGCSYCFMEVSSHAIHQQRVEGIEFKGMAFTNLTHDHLDYHKTFKEYRDVKKLVFDSLSSDAFALVNKDDKNGKYMLQNCSGSGYTYGLKSMADFKAKILEMDFRGMLLRVDEQEFWCSLTGQFNVYNLLAAYGIAFLLGKNHEEVITALSAIKSARGRFDVLESGNGLVGIVDYAHTPDALSNVLNTINAIRTRNEELITVVGCGGNRDKEKRPVMGEVAARLSDKVFITSDNPRDEEPSEIMEEIVSGIDARDFKKVLKIVDRREAIRAAVLMASPGDIILVAGKGHETYQEIKGVKKHFDDKEELLKNFELIEN